MELGTKGYAECTVNGTNTAKAMGSGGLEVLATPAMIALMEKASCESVQPHLEPGSGTVGTFMNVTHDAPSPVGMRIHCTSELVAADDRKLVFRVAAFDEAGKIGGGVHERCIIQNERFQSRANAKLNSQ